MPKVGKMFRESGCFSLNCLISKNIHVHAYIYNIKKLGVFMAYISQENTNVIEHEILIQIRSCVSDSKVWH